MLIESIKNIFKDARIYKNVPEIALRRYSAGEGGERPSDVPHFSYATIDPLMGYYDIAQNFLFDLINIGDRY